MIFNEMCPWQNILAHWLFKQRETIFEIVLYLSYSRPNREFSIKLSFISNKYAYNMTKISYSVFKYNDCKSNPFLNFTIYLI